MARRIRVALEIIGSAYAIILLLYLVLRVALGTMPAWWMGFANTFAMYLFLPLLMLIPLALVLKSRPVLIRLLPFGVIATVWFAPMLMPRATSVSPGEEVLRVVTFNVLPQNLSQQDRRLEIVSWLSQMDADVIVLQEVPFAVAEDGIAQLRETYPHQVGLTDARRLLLSRYPIVESMALYSDELPTLPQQRVVLDVAGQHMTVYNIHLTFPFRDTPRINLPLPTLLAVPRGLIDLAFKYDESVRNQQIRHVLGLITQETNPVIAAGDFNMSPTAMMYGELAAALSDSHHAAGHGFGLSWPSDELAEFRYVKIPLLRLDYVWHSTHFRALEVWTGPELGSDHLPVVADLAYQAL